MQNHFTPGNGRTGRLEAINRSAGGVPKLQVGKASITASGVEGDRQRDLSRHGGPDRAVTLYSWELIQALAGEGHPIGIGTTGENLTVAGLDWSLVVPGVELLIGEAEGQKEGSGPVRLRITRYTGPCFKIKGSFANGDESRIAQDIHPGWSRLCARVLAAGVVCVGDTVALL